MSLIAFFFQAEDGMRDLVRSRGLGDVYKRQVNNGMHIIVPEYLKIIIKLLTFKIQQIKITSNQSLT